MTGFGKWLLWLGLWMVLLVIATLALEARGRGDTWELTRWGDALVYFGTGAIAWFAIRWDKNSPPHQGQKERGPDNEQGDRH